MEQQKMTFERQITKTVRLNYLLYLPQDYDSHSNKRWPLILFLHGAGERGDDLEQVKTHGIPKIVEEVDDFPFITVSPQCPEDSLWSDHFEVLDALLKEIEENYRVDPGRIYLTGLSLGGYGSWHFATLYPKRFAAVVPICGGGMPMYGFPDRVSVLKDVPLWVFHGAKDETVPLEESQKLVDVLKRSGGNVRFTVYPDAEHDSWTRTYENPELYEWLLKQKRP